MKKIKTKNYILEFPDLDNRKDGVCFLYAHGEEESIQDFDSLEMFKEWVYLKSEFGDSSYLEEFAGKLD